jgi:hypothetical protein
MHNICFVVKSLDNNLLITVAQILKQLLYLYKPCICFYLNLIDNAITLKLFKAKKTKFKFFKCFLHLFKNSGRRLIVNFVLN